MTNLTDDLFNPELHTQAVDVSGNTPAQLLADLRAMWLIRLAEEKIGDMVHSGRVKCPSHLGIGQEAVAVGVSSGLRRTDRVFGAHRSHSHYLALGGSAYQLFAEVLGREEGCSRGMGGSMHLYDAARAFMGSVPIVAGTISLAVGAAIAAKMDGHGSVAVAYFGDGAAEEGVLHECLNLASKFELPILFICENNLFSSHLHINLRQPSMRVARFADAHCIENVTIDGNDVCTVRSAAGRAIERARSGSTPFFLEAVTYRWRGHVGPREDTDVGVQRGTDLGRWKQRDPIRRLADGMISGGMLTTAQYGATRQDMVDLIEDAWLRAENAPHPSPEALLGRVYANS